MKVLKPLGDLSEIGTCANSLGNAYAAAGKHKSAVKSLEQALAVGKQIGDANIQMEASHQLSDLYHRLGDADKALRYASTCTGLFCS
jgi:tetratricopeptide (TPR) repeat protein